MTRKGGLIFGIIMSIGFTFVVIFVKVVKSTKNAEQRKRHFSGIIENVTFGEKGVPTIVIAADTIYMGIYDPGIHPYLQIGDSIVKLENSLNYLLYRKNDNDQWQLIYEGTGGSYHPELDF